MTKPTPRHARLWHLFRLARILWSAAPRRSLRARLGDLKLLARLIRKRQITHVPGRLGPRGFLARDGNRVHALYTHPDARRQGIASLLMHEAKRQAERLELWTAQDNTQARAFYVAHGFYTASLGFGQGNDDGLPDLRMIWEKDAP
ncbi:GNAT family N-acetyltransferase [Alisedimentitalea sp. MJ-SS2]|uniref:GNAT family N-acetyltransferase n=1 Tax=Aliisedimentitalea sp. MJ-SS2 TaxID=3049795 RepID=UPI0029071245|nr:GNAT family N-acetyltransferase [Alisedimentitalea sp. MJ-SS2]MDU8928655.1 GNAT family N-acetyltransferase [Alisedimentitalea sp. MJ-SS2]